MRNKWDERYLRLAYGIAQWSKDPSSKIGAITVGSKGQVLSQGFNGFPRGLRDEPSRLNDRETKYKYVVHAEMNAIYNATYNGTSLDGATLYVYGLPTCSECAKGVIQVGIKRVVMPNQKIDGKWLDSWMQTESFFDEAGIEYEFIDFDPRAESGQ
jgi:dCMP deaminase